MNPGQAKLRDDAERKGLDRKDSCPMTPLRASKCSSSECRVVVTAAGEMEEQEAAVCWAQSSFWIHGRSGAYGGSRVGW